MTKVFLFLFLAAWLVHVPEAAHAYVGPGAGLTAIGTLISLLAAILLAIVGFLWYPIKRLLRGRKTTDVKGYGDHTT